MRSIVDERLRQEAATYRLRFGCEHCIYLEPETRACSELFPNEEHIDVQLVSVDSLFFCKKFELY